MNSKNTDKKLIGIGVVTAIGASLCCITPVLALISGASGMASAFSWIEPFRPYLIGITILVLGIAWYMKLKPKKVECDCETGYKSSFFHSKTFLLIITVFAILMLAFPYYSRIFYPDTKQNSIVVDSKNIKKMTFEMEGMTCQSCEDHVKHEVNKLNGIISSEVSYEEALATIEFDTTRTTLIKIINAINATGYTVKSSSIINQNYESGK